MEHYKSSCTPQSTKSTLPPITPTADNHKLDRPDDTCLPPELCSKCTHGFKVCMVFTIFFVVILFGHAISWLCLIVKVNNSLDFAQKQLVTYKR